MVIRPWRSLTAPGSLKLDSISDEVVLSKEDLLIEMTQMEGYVTQSDNNITVVLDTNLTPELIEEGFVREIISKIQTMRKDAGFEVMDHIAVTYEADEKLSNVFESLVMKSRPRFLPYQLNQANLRAMKRIGRLMVRLLSLQLKNNNLCTRGSINLLPFSAIRRNMMRDNTFSKKVFIKTVSDNLKNKYRKTINDATQQELYQAVSEAVKDVIMDEWIATQRVMDKDDPKVVYYMSMEFLMGRALGNNLINLSAYKEVKEALTEIGVDINAIEDQEPDPALGNGGLGRLAACFMDSLATLGYPAYGCGIRYRYGMFKQQISDGFQIEVPDNWLKDGYPFELRRPEYCYEVKFGGYVQESTDENGELHFEQKDYQSVLAVPYDMPIVGYDNNVVNSLMIWDAEPKTASRSSPLTRVTTTRQWSRKILQETLLRCSIQTITM